MEMLPRVRKEFPELYTNKGELRKREPMRYKCDCGNSFSEMKKVNYNGYVIMYPICNLCGEKANLSTSYKVWKRMVNKQIEQEDFILKVVNNNPFITKTSIQRLMKMQFENDVNALAHLVYFGYLKVNEEKRDRLDILEYTVNSKKDLTSRYENII